MISVCVIIAIWLLTGLGAWLFILLTPWQGLNKDDIVVALIFLVLGPVAVWLVFTSTDRIAPTWVIMLFFTGCVGVACLLLWKLFKLAVHLAMR